MHVPDHVADLPWRAGHSSRDRLGPGRVGDPTSAITRAY